MKDNNNQFNLTCPNCGTSITFIRMPSDILGSDDAIIFDYNESPIDVGILEYLAALIHDVSDRAARMGIDGQFVFKMSPKTWDAICTLYIPPDDFLHIPTGEATRAKLIAKQCIIVDGTEYAVELVECKNDIYFVPDNRIKSSRRNFNVSYLAAILRKGWTQLVSALRS